MEAGEGQGHGAPSEAEQEELRKRLEEQLAKIRVQDLVLESVASILNLAARRITKADERDLEQGRLGIDAVRALLDLLEPEAREQVREALSQIQMLYAREAQGGGEAAEGAVGEGGGPEPGPSQPAQGGEPEQSAGERPPGLWVPPGT